MGANCCSCRRKEQQDKKQNEELEPDLIDDECWRQQLLEESHYTPPPLSVGVGASREPPVSANSLARKAQLVAPSSKSIRPSPISVAPSFVSQKSSGGSAALALTAKAAPSKALQAATIPSATASPMAFATSFASKKVQNKGQKQGAGASGGSAAVEAQSAPYSYQATVPAADAMPISVHYDVTDKAFPVKAQAVVIDVDEDFQPSGDGSVEF